MKRCYHRPLTESDQTNSGNSDDLRSHSPTANRFQINFFTAVQQKRRFQLSERAVWSLCNSWASCVHHIQLVVCDLHQTETTLLPFLCSRRQGWQTTTNGITLLTLTMQQQKNVNYARHRTSLMSADCDYCREEMMISCACIPILLNSF